MASYLGEDNDEPIAPAKTGKSHRDQKQDGKEGEYVLRPGDELCSGITHLNLAPDFAPSWTTAEGFRDFFQNWRDEAMSSFGLKHDDLIFENEESQCEVKLFSPGLRRYLGYIRYNKKTGNLDMTNYEARLTRQNLLVGGSTKGKNANLAGVHGEGLKAASLVMVRNGHQVKFEASGFYLYFELPSKQPTEFVCKIRKPPSTVLQKKEREYKERCAEYFLSTLPESNLCGDVTVIIRKVKLAEFREWLKLCLDLESPSDVIKVGEGRIILDPAYSGRIYLKGLLLQNYPPIKIPVETPTGAPVKQFKYGYNLSKGEADRDRRNLVNSGEEKGLAHTWIDAISKERAEPVKLAVKLFVDLLLEAEKHCWVDVRNAQDYIIEEVAEEMWEYLRGQHPKQEIFYHNQRNVDRDVEIIEGSLKRKAVPLPSSIWDPLSKFGLIWTPQREQRRLLRRAPSVDIVDIASKPYSDTLLRTLHAAMALDERTQPLELSFKTGDRADLALLLNGSKVLTHMRWFDFYACHARSPCQVSDRALAESSIKDYNHEPFLCDHIVMYLYGLLLVQLMPGSCYGGQKATDRLLTKVSECVDQMPRNIEIAQGSQQGTIKVSWMDIASARAKSNGVDLKCRIILHESTCKGKRDEWLAQESIPENGTQLYSQHIAECGCPKQIVLQKDSEAYFEGLDLEKKYFPMVASQSANAFYAHPPKPLQPNQAKSDSINLHGRSTLSSRTARPAHVEEHDSDLDMHGVSSGGEDNIDIDSSRTTPCPRGSGKRIIPMEHTPYKTSTGTPNHLDTGGSQFSHTPNQSSRKAPVRSHTVDGAGSRIHSKQSNVVRDKFRPVVQDQQGRGVPVDLDGGNRDTRENAREHHDPRAATNPIHPEVQQTRETPRNTEGCQSFPAQTQESYPGQKGQQASPRAGTSGPASENQLPEDRENEIRDLHQSIQQLQSENQQLLAENRRLHTELTASNQNLADMKYKYSRLKAEVATASKQAYATALRLVRNGIDKLANISWDTTQVPNAMAGTNKPAEPQENFPSAGLKREIIQDGEASGERAAKRPRWEPGEG